MGLRGKAPAPTAILKLRGSTRVTKKRERLEMDGGDGLPARPKWLTGRALAAWKELVPLLEATGVLTRIDGNMLGRYCVLFARWRDAEEFLAQNGSTYPLKDSEGKVFSVRRWPQVVIAESMADRMARIEDRFGMNPSARSRIMGLTRDTRSHNTARHADNIKYFGAG